tara:strand:+ start:249 stop:449 length:201 start_codon:yes stop_codon:yes gene_type:complete
MTTKNDVTGDLIRSKTDGQKAYSDGWDAIFGNVKARKKIPKHGSTQIHKDKSKQIPRHYKYNNIEE